MKRHTRATYPDVWAMVARIPQGSVATYGQIARLLGIPGHARFVGYALHALPPGAPVPWHRVVNSRGKVSLPGESGRTQTALLAEDGVAVPPAGIDLIRRGWKASSPGRRERKAAAAASRRRAKRGGTPPG
jgi:methylated-DNA-protein-cysteine methyltransferase related protein